MGRSDLWDILIEQVKLRGYRIELQKIEAAICMHEGIQDAIVLVREDVPGSKRLVGYHVAATEGQPPGVEELRQFIKDKLPEYMVPSAFVGLSALPFTPGGKVDRRALPLPTSSVTTRRRRLSRRARLRKNDWRKSGRGYCASRK